MYASRRLASLGLIFGFTLAFLVSGLLACSSPVSASSSDPSVVTRSATDIYEDGATLNGKLVDDSSEDISEYGFYWGTSSDPADDGEKEELGSSLDEGDTFSFDLDDLDEDTRYYFVAYVEYDDGDEEALGSVKSFITSESEDEDESQSPVIETGFPQIGDDSAVLYGTLIDAGDSYIESYGFYYGTDSTPDDQVEVDDEDIGDGETFTYELSDLDEGTIYYVRAYASNDDGTSYGRTISFQIGDFQNGGFHNGGFQNGIRENWRQQSGQGQEQGQGRGKQSMLYIGSRDYKIRGETYNGDVAPFLNNGRTFLPIRPVAYALGIDDEDITWDDKEQTITLNKDSQTVVLQIGNNMMTHNGKSVKMDTAPQISGGRACLPVAMVAQAFGADVSWDADQQRVTIE